MASLTIDIPDDLVAQIDACARYRRTTRDDVLRDGAQRELAAAREARRRRVEQLLAEATGAYGGDNARSVREMRNAR